MPNPPTVVSVTLNTAIDRVLSVPGFQIGGHLPAKVVSHFPAGKGVNFSRALARLGRSNVATGFVGQNEAERFEDVLRMGEGFGRVNNQLLSVRGPTRENITVVDPDTKSDTHLRTQGYELTEHDIARISTKVGLLSREGTVFVFAGSLPPGMDDPVLAKLVRSAQWGGADVVLDLDGKLLGAVLGAVGKAVWMVSPNRAEFVEALGLDKTLSAEALLDAARHTSDRAGWVLISMASEGAMLVTPDGAWRGVCPLDRQRIVSTVGSGDCLVAAVVDAHLHGLDPDESLRRGLAVATASTLNAYPGDFDMKDVRELAQSVEVTTLG